MSEFVGIMLTKYDGLGQEEFLMIISATFGKILLSLGRYASNYSEEDIKSPNKQAFRQIVLVPHKEFSLIPISPNFYH